MSEYVSECVSDGGRELFPSALNGVTFIYYIFLFFKCFRELVKKKGGRWDWGVPSPHKTMVFFMEEFPGNIFFYKTGVVSELLFLTFFYVLPYHFIFLALFKH